MALVQSTVSNDMHPNPLDKNMLASEGQKKKKKHVSGIHSKNAVSTTAQIVFLSQLLLKCVYIWPVVNVFIHYGGNKMDIGVIFNTLADLWKSS